MILWWAMSLKNQGANFHNQRIYVKNRKMINCWESPWRHERTFDCQQSYAKNDWKLRKHDQSVVQRQRLQRWIFYPWTVEKNPCRSQKVVRVLYPVMHEHECNNVAMNICFEIGYSTAYSTGNPAVKFVSAYDPRGSSRLDSDRDDK